MEMLPLFVLTEMAFEKGEMRQTRENWDKMLGEVGQVGLSGLAVTAPPGSVVACPEAPQQVQTGSDWVVSV